MKILRLPSLFRLALTAGILSVVGMVPFADMLLRTYTINNDFPGYCLDRIDDVSEQPHIEFQTSVFPPSFSCIDTDTGQAITEYLPSGWLLLAWPLLFIVLGIGEYAHRRRLNTPGKASPEQIARSQRTWRLTSALFLIGLIPFIHFGFTLAHATGTPQQFCTDLVREAGEQAGAVGSPATQLGPPEGQMVGPAEAAPEPHSSAGLYSVESNGPVLSVGCYLDGQRAAHRTLWSNWLFLALAGVVWFGPAAVIRAYLASEPAPAEPKQASPATARAQSGSS